MQEESGGPRNNSDGRDAHALHIKRGLIGGTVHKDQTI